MFATALKKHDDELKRKSEQSGVRKGIQKGIQSEKIEAARKMHKKGFALQDIIDITGLTACELGREGIE